MIHASCQSFGTDPMESWMHYAVESHKVASQTGVYIYTLSKYERVDTIVSTDIWEKTHSSFNVLLEQESHTQSLQVRCGVGKVQVLTHMLCEDEGSCQGCWQMLATAAL